MLGLVALVAVDRPPVAMIKLGPVFRQAACLVLVLLDM